ncbi:transglutaminase domain-containing protein [Emticicia oligotrophica DSM 17448]|uniref:Transglutaminase domain-containing protein n=1 Tax=Emticicia oligotrophica (strain DSM 17448 / CIP 109782 / MTCC 6937 / GPTSA100-15) TaxID=929562 RepID=A0ABM5N3E7_EMTOG|nr:transglutaminase family protein [Emticicia oligotrophica]AFK04002.1 transglutaminase domain-containing protein [Emticicia oligotrophica DSM 17448]
MILRVEHTLHYSYTAAVLLTPHLVYMSPRISINQQLLAYSLEILPTPSLYFHNLDAEGNTQSMAFFNQNTESLSFKLNFQINSEPYNPFQFIYFPFEAEKIPFKYSATELNLLQAYFKQEGVTTLIHQFSRQIASEAYWETTSFLMMLARYIQENFNYEIREQGEANPPEKTLISRKGSCRDYAVLMIATCRAIGLAARFVSGYCFGNELQAHELHAWVEVYLPGAGWRGFDPTEGKMVDGYYIALAASADAELINPVKGSFRGNALSKLNTYVNIYEEFT